MNDNFLTQKHMDLLNKYGITDIQGSYDSQSGHYFLDAAEWSRLNNLVDDTLRELEIKANELKEQAKVTFDCYGEVLNLAKQNIAP